jgi:rRNA maturation RNase YbeY
MVRRAVLRVLRKEGRRRARLSVVLAGSRYIKTLNRTYLRHDDVTDVMSFCLESGKNLEGEIYVNIDRARQQARHYKVGVSDEIVRLAAHGTLHLVGYDDGTPREARRMRAREDEHVAYWKRKRRA